MGVAAYAILFLSIIGCIVFGFIKWNREGAVPSVHDEHKEQKKAAV